MVVGLARSTQFESARQVAAAPETTGGAKEAEWNDKARGSRYRQGRCFFAFVSATRPLRFVCDGTRLLRIPLSAIAPVGVEVALCKRERGGGGGEGEGGRKTPGGSPSLRFSSESDCGSLACA